MSTWRVRRAGVALIVLLAVGVGASGCGSSSELSPPSGVDELVIPTPSPDPRDFVAGVDNPWFPLPPGSVSEYALTGPEGPGEVTVTVGKAIRVVAGVATTEVTTSTHAGTFSGDHTDFYAQDRAGNVWWFGRAGEWEAGAGGAAAGVVMPAAPRVGDGFRLALLDGVVEDRAQVLSVDGTLDASPVSRDHLVVLVVSSELQPGTVQQRFYARGVGLVHAGNVEGPVLSITLRRGPDD
jgi:hypothetical protein